MLSAPSLIPYSVWAGMVLSGLRGRRRSIFRDGLTIWHSLEPEPRVLGEERVPSSGALLVLANHYNGPGIFVGPEVALLAAALGRPRAGQQLRAFAVTQYENVGIWRFFPVLDRLTAFIFARLYNVYNAIPTARASASAGERGRGVRRLLDATAHGEMVLLFPEGGNVENFTMKSMRPGVADLVRLALRKDAQVVLAGVYQECGRFFVNIGEPLDRETFEANRDPEDFLGRGIASLLPESLRGPYA